MADTFEGFGPDAFKFLAALDFHQSREWFAENRSLYETQLRAPLLAFCVEAASRARAHDLDMRFEPKTGTFRINRDVRFTNDKRPYNRHVSAVLSRDGTKAALGVLYVHVGLERCFFAAGFWALPKDELAACRRSVIENPHRYRAMVEALGEGGLALDEDDALKRLPRGWDDPGETDLRHALRLKGYTASEDWPREEAHGRGLIERFDGFARRAAPLLGWGRAILD